MTLKIHIMLRIHHKVRAPLVVRYVHGLRTVGFFPVLPERTRCLWLRVTSTTTAVRPVGRTPSSGSHSWSCSLPTTQVQRAVGGRRRSPPPRPSKAAPLLCFFFCSRGELCPDPSAHVSRLRPGGNGRALRRGAGRPLPLEHQRERALKVDATADSEEPSLYLCFCPCRTSFFWATSTPTVPTSQAQTGTRSVSSPTTASTGWSTTRPTPRCHTLTAPTTGEYRRKPGDTIAITTQWQRYDVVIYALNSYTEIHRTHRWTAVSTSPGTLLHLVHQTQWHHDVHHVDVKNIQRMKIEFWENNDVM